MSANTYLNQILQKYAPRGTFNQTGALATLKSVLRTWAGDCYIDVLDSGSRAKGTAISLASDIDYMVSLTSGCNENNGGLKSIFDSLYTKLNSTYNNVRKQNVSVRINLNELEIDVTPARKQSGNTTDHWIYLSKTGTRQQTNIQKHIADISGSGRVNEIKILKIWRELNKIDFPSVYLEYLIVKIILLNYPKDSNSLPSNVLHVFSELARDTNNPLFARVVDPANTNNILSDLLSASEKNEIIKRAKVASKQQYWKDIVW